jgi:hypothetical protein
MTWPDQLPRPHFALLPLPYPAGKVGPGLAGEKLRTEPMVIHHTVKDDSAWLDLMTAELIRSSLRGVPDGITVAAEPSILEELRLGRLHSQTLRLRPGGMAAATA